MQNIEKLIDARNENMHPLVPLRKRDTTLSSKKEDSARGERERRVLFMKQEMFLVAKFQDE